MFKLSDENLTFAKLKVFEIKQRLIDTNLNIEDLNSVEVMNIALITFELLCEAHIDGAGDTCQIINDMYDDKQLFVEYLHDFKQQGNDRNAFLNAYLEKQMTNKRGDDE